MEVKDEIRPLSNVASQNQPAIEDNINDLDARIKTIESKLTDYNNQATQTHKQIERASTFIMWVVGVIAVIFLTVLIQISNDYMRTSPERAQALMSEVSNLREDVVNKTDINPYFTDTEMNTRILNCLSQVGYFSKICFFTDVK